MTLSHEYASRWVWIGCDSYSNGNIAPSPLPAQFLFSPSKSPLWTTEGPPLWSNLVVKMEV
jgi:hypothetical protein